MLIQKEVKAVYLWTTKVRPTIPATAISLDKSSISLTTVGQTSQITATLTPADSTSKITWSSSNTSIATVSQSWLVTCVTPWSCTITATTNNWLTATCSVTASTIIYYDFTTVSYIPYDISVRKWSWSVSSWLKVTNQWATITRNIGSLSGKSSFRIEATGTRTSTSWAWFNGIWITNRQGSSSATDYAWYITYEVEKARGSNASYSDSNGIKREWSANSRTSLTALTTTSTIGDYALYFEVNLSTWYVTAWGTAPSSWSTNYTLSSSYLTELKNMQHAFFWTYPANSSSDTLKTLKITIS